MPPFLTDENRAEVTSLLLLISSVSSLSKMPIRPTNTEPNHDLSSSSLLDGANYDEWTIILLRLALVSKLLSSRKTKFGSIDGNITKPSTTLEDSTNRHSAIHNLLDRLYWLLREEVISTGEDRLLCHDRLSFLPESLRCHILSFLTTKEAVRTSVLSSSWRDLWQWVPKFDLESSDFPNDKACVDFINNFLLDFKSLSGFRLRINKDDVEKSASLYKPCLGNLINRKIQHFHVLNCRYDNKLTLVTLPVCEALVSLKLDSVRLNEFESLSLPCLKDMVLVYVTFPSDAVLDTPRLEQLFLIDYQFKSFKKISMSDSVEVYINVFLLKPPPYDLSDRNKIYNSLNKFSAVRDMTLSQLTLEFIYGLRDMNPLPKFRDLTHLSADIWLENCLELVPFVLERCPNLKHLTLELIEDKNPEAVTDSLSNVLSFCLVSSLEYVEIECPITEKATERELVGYFLGNATSLKKLVLVLNVSDGEKYDVEFLKQCFDSPRRSNLCQFEVLLVVQTPDKIEL